MTYPTIWDGIDNEGDRAQLDPGGRRFQLSDAMIEAWSCFARTGAPTQDRAWQTWSGQSGVTAVVANEGISYVQGHKDDRWNVVRDLPRPW